MQIFDYKNKASQTILALGAESAGNFSILHKNKIYFSDDFGDLLEDANYRKFKNELNKFLKKEGVKPNIILTDLHPLYKTTFLGKELSKKYKAQHIQIQHHLAHIFSAIGEKQLLNKKYKTPDSFCGIAMDGTGYGYDGKIWGGEIFEISKSKFQISNSIPIDKQEVPNTKLKIQRIGHLENQILLGGDLAIQEPARILIGILAKFLSKKEVYRRIKKYYSTQEFEILYNQLRQNFNCLEASSAGRVLDAVSLLLGFCDNKRNYKHEPIELLEKNSDKPYANLKPVIQNNILMTTPLFEYLLKNIHKDKKRLAATAQLYIAEGLYKIISNFKFQISNCYFVGGIANNKIISTYLESKGTYTNKKIPRGDAGLSFGQILYINLWR